jgi:perosamine synthetase
VDDAMMNERIPVSQPHFYGMEGRYVADALSSTFISGDGPYVDRMESMVAAAAGVRHAIAVANGTVALDLALKALGVKAGDEVIVPDFSMFSPIGAVLRAGALPIAVDADASWNLDPVLVEAAITPRTRGILMVHTYGCPANGPALRQIADRHNLWLLEDAAEAMGGTFDGQLVGSFGDIATFSFYSNKVVTSGEGGAVVTHDDKLASKMRDLRNLSFGKDWSSRFIHEDVGFNFRLSNVLAAIGCAQLENLSTAVRAKQEIAAEYLRCLADFPGLEFQPVPPTAIHTYWVFALLLPLGVVPQEIADTLLKSNIETRPFFHPVHRQPCLNQAIAGSFPMSNSIAERGFYLPSYVGLEPEKIYRICEALSLALERDTALA